MGTAMTLSNAKIRNWTAYRRQCPDGWAPEWPILRPEHLENSPPWAIEPWGPTTSIQHWARRVHPRFGERILAAVVTNLSRWINVEPLMTWSTLALGPGWEPVHRAPYRPALCVAWAQTAEVFGYTRVRGVPYARLVEAAVEAERGDDFDRMILHIDPLDEEEDA